EDPISTLSWKESQLPARELSLQLHSMEVSSADKFEGAFKEATRAGSAALALMSSPFFFSHQKQIVDLVAKNRLPAIYGNREFASRRRTHLAKLSIEKGLITRQEFMEKISEERATYEKLVSPTP